MRIVVEGLYPGFTELNHPPTEEVDEALKLTENIAINELIQVHLTEIRAIVLQYLLKSAILVHTASDLQPKIARYMDSLIRDEARHIEYTAEIFEDAICNGERDFVFTTLADRQADLNLLTYKELEMEKINI